MDVLEQQRLHFSKGREAIGRRENDETLMGRAPSLVRVDLTADSFSALARSSPWRWTALRFRHRNARHDVEAWVRRPGWLLVRDAEGVDHVETGVPYTRSVIFVGGGGVETPPEPKSPQDVQPRLRADGLVAERPDDPDIEYDDPMYDNFAWVAMLDPVELSHDVRVTSLRADERAGRDVWRAQVSAQEGYDPRCSCCALLWSWVSDSVEHDAGGPPPRPVGDYPSSYEIALDVQTGVVSELHPVGDAPDHCWFELDILAVDDDVTGPGAPRGRPPRGHRG
jgi:hypothetical protein